MGFDEVKISIEVESTSRDFLGMYYRTLGPFVGDTRVLLILGHLVVLCAEISCPGWPLIVDVREFVEVLVNDPVIFGGFNDPGVDDRICIHSY